MRNDRELPDDDEPASNAGEALFDWPRESGRLGEVMAEIRERERRSQIRRRRQTWTAGALAIVLLVGGLAFYRSPTGLDDSPGRLARAAKVTVPDRQVLPDGSLIELKGDAEVTVNYTEGERRVVLRRGEAHFEVKKDARRAFVVDAAGIEFRAVGTAFAVQLEARRVEMIVTEGRVAVARADAPREASVALAIVDAGSQAEVHLDGQTAGRPAVQALQPQQLTERLAWRIPRLELSETPLAEVVAAFNRFGRVRIEIGDRALDSLAISGILRADNAGALVRVLESNYGIRAEQGIAETIVLRAAERN